MSSTAFCYFGLKMPHILMSAIIQHRGHQLNYKKNEHSSYTSYKGKVYMDLNI